MPLLRRKINRVSDDMLAERTGKNWKKWFLTLDKAGARMLEHQEIVGWLRNTGMTDWLSQSVALAYEHDRNLRVEHEKPMHYAAIRSRTMAAPVEAIWTAWNDPETRERWLPGARYDVLRAAPLQTLRLKWPDGSSVGMRLVEIGGKTKVEVAHTKLPHPDELESLQIYWTEALDRLKALVEHH